MKTKKSRELPRHHRQNINHEKNKKKNDVTGVAKIIHPYKKENKQNKNTHTHNVTPKNYRETAVLIGICVDFCLCLNSTRFPLNVIL